MRRREEPRENPRLNAPLSNLLNRQESASRCSGGMTATNLHCHFIDVGEMTEGWSFVGAMAAGTKKWRVEARTALLCASNFCLPSTLHCNISLIGEIATDSFSGAEMGVVLNRIRRGKCREIWGRRN